MPKAIDLLDTLTTTELVQLKDSNIVELDRLSQLLTNLNTPYERRQLAPFLKSRFDLDEKLKNIIGARLLESLDTATNTNKSGA